MDVVALDSGDAAATRALQMEGGSLPPRKRLLAGLKLNGLLSSSPPPVASPERKYEEGCCMGCSTVESSGVRRIKRGGVVLRLCSACTLLYSKSMFCPHCLAMYHDASLLGDPSMWLVCTRCRRSVHPECEQKHSGGKPEAASYVCLDCVNRRQREANGVSTGMRSKPSGSGVDFVSPALKKPRMHRDRPRDYGDGSRFEPCLEKGASLGVPPRKVVSSQAPPVGDASPQEAAVIARNAATAAAKVAAAAKANAAAKASASVRAAAAAKAALEAAAHAAKAEAASRAELRRKLGNAETRPRLEINVHSEPRRERSSMKYERDDGYAPRRAGGAGSVDDEELARQLHRVINSSPRISRSMTPMRRKASVKPETPSSGVSNSSAETVRARPRPSPVEPEHEHHQFRQRPRSVTHKEFRRIDSRVSRHEVKATADEEIGQPLQEPIHGEDLAVKSEAMDGVMFAPVGVQDEASILFDALVEADREGMPAAAATGEGSHDQRPDYLQEILEAAVLSDAAMFNDDTHHDLDTVRSEPVAFETSTLHVEAIENPQAPDATADEVPVTIPEEVTVTMTEEAAVAMTDEARDSVAVETSDALVMHPLSSGQGEENDSAVVHDVEMHEVGGTTPEPSSTRVEERSAVQESTNEANPSTLGAEVPLIEPEETNSGPTESEAQAPSEVTATEPTCPQSG